MKVITNIELYDKLYRMSVTIHGYTIEWAPIDMTGQKTDSFRMLNLNGKGSCFTYKDKATKLWQDIMTLHPKDLKNKYPELWKDKAIKCPELDVAQRNCLIRENNGHPEYAHFL